MPKTFNNQLGFERGFWRRQQGRVGALPKTADIG